MPRQGLSYSECGRLGALASKEVQAQAKADRIEVYNQSPNCCRYCQKAIPYEKRWNDFCSRSCSVTLTNQGLGRNVTEGKFKLKPCKRCGKISKNTIFCSMTCCHKYKWQQLCEQIMSTGVFPEKKDKLYGYTPVIVRRYLTETRGWKCEICGGETWRGQKIPLVLDHENGDPKDNRVLNLRLVCGNCNMQLPTFCGRNKGKGRKNRRKLAMSSSGKTHFS